MQTNIETPSRFCSQCGQLNPHTQSLAPAPMHAHGQGEDLLPDMSQTESLRYLSERKNPNTTLLFCLFLGGVGAHQFYLGRIGLGVLYLIFVLSGIPLVVSIIELLFVKERTRARTFCARD